MNDGRGESARTKPVAVRVGVPRRDSSYDVVVGPGLSAQVPSMIRARCPKAGRVALVTDENVAPHYADALEAGLAVESFETRRFVLPPGEETKTLASLEQLVEGFIDFGLSRSDLVVTLGGGVIGDLGGLAAATFMRGIDFVQVPTSLLAQVDASVGGKVAVDLPSGKNLFGAFHFPRLVAIDPDVLRTLPDRELACGLAEMIKHAALFSREHFDELGAAIEAIYGRDGSSVAPLVATSVAHKANCVARDPREASLDATGRIVLNLGHTVGHALESLSNFELQHGEAVALGLIATMRVSHGKLGAPAELEERLVDFLVAARLPHDLDGWVARVGEGALIELLARDKKRRSVREISFVGLTDWARPRVISLPPAEIVRLLRRPTSAP